MSSVTVLCPNGHRVKVTTNPNMSLQAVLETAASKKGFEPSEHILEFHQKRLDLGNQSISKMVRVCWNSEKLSWWTTFEPSSDPLKASKKAIELNQETT